MLVQRTILVIIAGLFPLVAGELTFSIDSAGAEALPAQIVKTLDTVYALNRGGLDALEKKNYETAMSFFDRALRLAPEFSDAWNNRGVVKFRQGDIAEARLIWSGLIEKDHSYPIAYYNLAIACSHEKAFDSAIVLLRSALQINPRFTEAQVRLGAIYLAQDQVVPALAILREARAAAPQNPDAACFLAYALIRNGDTSGAVALCKKYPESPETLKLLGRIAQARNDLHEAIAYLSKSELKVKDGSLLPEIADCQAEEKNCKGALETYSRYFGLPIAHAADAYLKAGIAANECGNRAAAQNYFEQGSRNFPRDGILRYNLGQVYFAQKKYDLAESIWSGLSDSMQDPSLLYMRALSARRQHDLTGAEHLVRKALAIDDQAEYHELLGAIFYDQGNQEKAAGEFRLALSINPDLRSAQMDLALCTKSPGELLSAAEALEREFHACSGDSCADAAERLAVVYYRQGMTEKSIAVLTSVKEQDRNERLYRTLAICYRDRHYWDQAADALETAVKNYVTEPQAEFELAETYLTAGHYAKAIEVFTRLLPRWRDNPWRICYLLGYASLERNDFAHAKGWFNRSLKNKETPAAKGLLAYIYNREGQAGQARELWKKALADDPSNPTVLTNLGLSYEKEGRYEEALTEYKKAEQAKADDPELMIGMGNCFSALGRYTDALEYYRQAMHSPKRELAVYNTFLVYEKKREKESAGKSVAILDGEFPNSIYTRRAKSELALWNGDTLAAAALLDSLPEKDAEDWLQLAHLYAGSGEQRKAQASLAHVPAAPQWATRRAAVREEIAFRSGDYKEVIKALAETGDTSFAARYNGAVANYKLGRYDEAISLAASLEKQVVTGSSGISPQDRIDLYRLAGNSAFLLKQWRAALLWYQQLSGMESESTVDLYNCAVASYNLGDYDNAYMYYNKARGRDPALKNHDIEDRYAAKHHTAATKIVISPADSLYNSALELQNAGNDTAAELLYLKTLATDSLYVMAWNNLGAIYGARGDLEQAEHAYLKAVERRHDIPETWANLVNLCIARHEFAKARQMLVRGQSYNPGSYLLELREKISAAEKVAAEEKAKKSEEKSEIEAK